MVNIYLPTDRGQVLALSIPFSDIERLSVRPVKWFRFVTFAICGVRGHLSESAMPNGTPVDYDSISLDNIAEAYYYTPEGDYHLIDHNALNDRITSSEQTLCSSRFRSDVMARDGPVCVFTGTFGEPRVLGINSVENGMFLNKTLHASFALGRSAFLKTPNFALDPADIPRVEAGPMPSSLDPIPQYDARITGTGTSLPSTVILDYIYGVAAYQRWGSGRDIEEVMVQRFAEYYKSIPIPPAPPHSSDSDRNHSTKMSDEMLRAMDKVLALSMLVKGTTPELMAAERQRTRGGGRVASSSQHHATMVNIYLPTDRGQVLALSIPFSDIERLSVRPVKWLRFVTFAICGVRGHLSESAIPNGTPVDYESISFDNIAEAYYYIPEGDYHLIDHKTMNDRITSSEQTTRSSHFRRDVMARDGPYIAVVLQDRLNSYDAALEPRNLDINSVENGMFLNKTLHASFALGRSAFLKTPNFALDPADIPRVEAGPMPSSRITLHDLVPDIGFNPIRQYDARITGTGTSLPSTVILDYIYGVAAYQRWGSGRDIEEVMVQRFAEYYKSIPIPPAPPHSSDSDGFSEPDHPNDGDYIPDRRPRGRNHSTKMSDEMLRAMDKVLALSMLVKGTTPELMAAERQRREEAEELRAKEASRVKVQQWMQSSPFCVAGALLQKKVAIWTLDSFAIEAAMAFAIVSWWIVVGAWEQ
ncbi:hypothetical protein F5887DRAFT_1065316 [Amanita rubescens]|nr:hypothetical protein F5887DRAFT_1065316 [Amanita rubescens]